MSSAVRRALLALSVFLVILPLTAGRPGQPVTLKADEPAYLMMAQSLLADGDLRCDRGDVLRAFNEFPYRPIHNLILMTTDGWETVYYGKPYIHSLFAAPLVAIAGVNGFFLFNMLLLVAMIWMGTCYLRQFNSDSTAALFSSLFFLLGPAFIYAFWIHTEIWNMFAIAGCLYFAFRDPDPGVATGRWTRWTALRWRPLWSGALLTLAVYNKPMLAILGVPALYRFWHRCGWKAAASWCGSVAASLALVAILSIALTSKPTPYLGVDRGGMTILSEEQFEAAIGELKQSTQEHRDEAANSWHWLFRFPEVRGQEFLRNLGYFLIGRHTGFVPYMPMAVLALLLFVLHARRSRDRWITLACAALTALTFLLWIPFNWHGGGGFVGNRYFANAYPAFLFLATVVRPSWLLLASTGMSTLLLGTALLTPWGAPVPNPTLQAHARAGVYRYLPLEIGFRRPISGHSAFAVRDIEILGRDDVYRVLSPAEGIFWTRGGTRAEVWLSTDSPREQVVFEVQTWAPDNRIRISTGAETHALAFEDAHSPAEKRRILTLRLPSGRTIESGGQERHFYRLHIDSSAGMHQAGNMLNVTVNPLFYVGAALTYVGTDQADIDLHRRRYRIRWQPCRVPPQATAGSTVTVPTRVRNVGHNRWPSSGNAPLLFSYQWLDENGRDATPRAAEASKIPRDIAPNRSFSFDWTLEVPSTPGSYTLQLTPLRKDVGRFNQIEGATCSGTVEVGSPQQSRAESSSQ